MSSSTSSNPSTTQLPPVSLGNLQIPARNSAAPLNTHEHNDATTMTDDNLISLSTPDVEFGAFISVPPASDPLSLHSKDLLDSDFGNLDTSADGTASSAQAPRDEPLASGSTSKSQNRQSWAFFDDFTRDAKEKAQQKRRDVLDELLDHQDDPMYWVETSRGDEQADTAAKHAKTRPLLDLEGLNLSTEAAFGPEGPVEHGVDHHHHHAHHRHRPLHPPSSPSSARLSPTRTTPPRLAPPLASTDSFSSLNDIDEVPSTTSPSSSSGTCTKNAPTPTAISRSQSRTDPTQAASQKPAPQRTQSQSYQALSSISSKLLSSFLGSTTTLPSSSSSTSSSSTYPNHSASIPVPSSSSHAHPPHSTSFYPQSSTTHSLPQRTLGTGPSPFAAHPSHPHGFASISGAPGFVPDDLDNQGWDKGGRFYEDLERSVDSLGSSTSFNTKVTPQRPAWDEDVRIPQGRSGHGRYATTMEGTSGFSARGSPFRATQNNSDPKLPYASPSPSARSRSADRRPGSEQGSRSGSRAGLTDTGRALMYGTSVRLVGRREGTSAVLDEGLANQLRPHLPPLARLPSAWTLLYSLDQHGSSLQTLYTLSSATSRPAVYFAGSHSSPPPTTPITNTLIIVQDGSSQRFGALLGGRIRQPTGDSTSRTERERYYGSGESFLWREVPSGDPPDNPSGEGTVEVFKWTGMNEYVALCDEVFLSFGGGDGTYGLYIDAELEGSSSWCPTFNNPPLSDTQTKKPPALGDERGRKRVVGFECVGLEVWGV